MNTSKPKIKAKTGLVHPCLDFTLCSIVLYVRYKPSHNKYMAACKHETPGRTTIERGFAENGTSQA